MNERKSIPAWLTPLLTVSIGAAVRHALNPWLGPTIPYGVFFAAIAFTALYSGFGPAVLATFLSALTAAFLFVEPLNSFLVGDPQNLGALGVFVLVGLFISYLGRVVHLARRKLEKRVQEVRRQAALIDLSPDAIITHTIDGTIKTWSRGAEKLYGWTAREAIGRKTSEVLKTGYPEPPDKIIPQIQSAGEWTGELEHSSKNGRRLIVQSYWHAETIDSELEVLESNVDITERKKAETELRENERQLRAMFDNAVTGIVRTDDRDHFVAVNDHLCRMLGYSRDELLTMSVRTLTYPEDRPLSDDLNAKLHDGRLPRLEYEKRYVKKDGSPLWVYVTVSAVRDESGRYLYSVGTVVDIDARKAAETELRLQAAALDAAANAISISKTDSLGTIVWTNPAFTTLTGYGAEEVLGKTHAILHSGEQDEAFYQKLWDKISRGEVWHGEIVNRRKDGTLYHEEMGITPLRDSTGKISHYVAIKQDITARKQAQAALRESEARLRTLADSVPILIWQCNAERSCDYFNKGWLEFTGRAAAEECGSGWIEGVHSEDRERCLKVFNSAAERREPFEMEYRLRHHSGAYRWIFDRGVPRFSTDGESFLGYIGGCIDINDRKQAENALRESEERFRAIFESSSDCILVWDRDYNYLYANQAAIDHVGTTRDKVIGKNMRDGLGHIPDFMHLWMERVDRAFAAGKPFRVEDAFPVGGRLVYSESQISPIRGASGNVFAVGVVYRDVTQRKEVEDALRRSELFYRQTLESIPGMVFTTRSDGYCDYQSQQWVDYTGVPMEQHLGDGWNKLLHPDDRPRAFAAWRTAVEEKAPYDLEYRVRRYDGVYEWFKVRGEPIRDEAGRIVRWFGVLANIESLKKTEEALNESERRFRGTFENAAVGITHTDREGNWLAFNEKLCEMLGYTHEEMMDMGFREVTHADDLPADWERYQKLMRGELDSYQMEKRYIRKDGKVIWLDIQRSLQRDEEGCPLYAINIVQNITARKQAQQALRESEERFQTLANGSPVLLWVNSLTGCEFVNRAYLEFLGVEEDRDVRGSGWSRFVHPDDLEGYVGSYLRALEQGAPFAAEFRFQRTDGEWRWMRSEATPRRDVSGALAGYVGASVDITDRKQAEEEMRAAHISAEHAKQAAERANAAKDQFLAVLSHELRTPLAPVLAGISLLQRKQCVDCDLRNELEIVRRNVELEARLIDDLLDLTRIERGKISLDRKLVYVCTILERVVDICRPDIQRRKIYFNVNVENPPHPVSGDFARLQQIFWNLLNNAVKFSNEGGSIFIRGYREDGQAIVEVADTGIGIHPEALSRIFRAFEQGDARVTRQFGGLGLGLAITKRLVELHGGTIRAESAGKGQGATFRVTLPIARTAEAEAEAEKAPVREPPFSRRILLVEDHADTATMMKELLEVSGYEVETVPDVAQGLEVTKRRDFDLLISDLGLPDGSGLELMEKLRQRPKPLKGIALSGFGREEDVRRSKEAGFIEHLTKPVDFDVLLAAVERVT